MKYFLLIISLCITSSTVFAQAKKKATASPKSQAPIANTHFFTLSIEGNGKKEEVTSSQFQSADGVMMPTEATGKTQFMYGGSNTNNDKSFSFNAWIPNATKGTYALGKNNTGLTIITSLFPNIPMFIPQSGSLEIKDLASQTGLITGSFNCTYVYVKDDGKEEKYIIKGSFKISR